MATMYLILTDICVWCSVAGAFENTMLDKPDLFGPSIALEGSAVDFYCQMPWIPANMSVMLKLYMKNKPEKVIGEYTVHFGEIGTFSLVITRAHDGDLICKASEINSTTSETTCSDSLRLRVITPVKGAAIVSHPPTDDLWEGQTLTLQCNITKGSYVSYNWLRNGIQLQTGYDTSSDSLIIRSLSVQHEGDYVCVPSNQFNDTVFFNSSSDVMTVQVKEYISKPEISLDVVKIEVGDFKIIVKCRSEKGTPLKTFSLLNKTQVIATETTDRNEAFFSVPIELNRDMGWVRCNSSNQGNWVLSEPRSLTVESVGGAVTVTPFKHVGRDFQVIGLVLRCKVERGTFPHYHWFLNNTRLEGRKHFYAVAWKDNSIVSLSVGPDSSGFYHCEASDRFDNSTRVHSRKMLISKEVLNKVSALVMMVVFSCFVLLILTVSVCCVYGAILRRRHSRKYPRIPQHEPEGKQQDEDEDYEGEDYLMVMDYGEDTFSKDDESVDEKLSSFLFV